MLHWRLILKFLLLCLLLSGFLQLALADSGEILTDSGSFLPLPEEPEILQENLWLNEIMVDPLEGKEWVEIYNTGEKVNLKGLQIADAVKLRFVFTEDVFLEQGGLILLEFYNVLNNDEDALFLINNEEKMIDSFAYGKTEDFFDSIEKGYSFGRSEDGVGEWRVFKPENVTRGQPNFIFTEEEVVEKEVNPQITFNEIMANAAGVDDGQEWIELKVLSGSLSLNDFVLRIDSTIELDLSEINLTISDEFILINPAEKGVVLKNSEVKLELFQKSLGEKILLEEFFYLEAREGLSWRKNLATGLWEENYHPTKGTVNILWNNLPQAVILIQGAGLKEGTAPFGVNVTAENSFDQDGDTLICFWDFGDGYTEEKCNPNTHSYQEGEYVLSLTVRDILGAENSVQQTIKANLPITSGGGGSVETAKAREEIVFNNEENLKIEISAVLPNPEGNDKGAEWFILENLEEETVNLKNWSLRNNKQHFVFDQNYLLEPREKRKFFANEFKLTLVNKNDFLRLLNPHDLLVSEVAWENATSGEEYGKLAQKEEVTTENNVLEEKDLVLLDFDWQKIRLSEIYPYPLIQEEQKEWIEIENFSDQAVDLAGWKLADLATQNKTKYIFPLGSILPARGFLVVSQAETKLHLNNKMETVFLINPQDEIADQLKYDTVKKGCAWARNPKDRFLLTCLPTPLQKNWFLLPKLKKDLDQDGLLDEDEINFYQTLPDKNDTDEDGMPDGFEVWHGLDPLQPNSEKTIYQNYLEETAILQIEEKAEESFILKGRTEPHAIVRLFLHSKLVVGAVKADAEGNWEYELRQKMEAGQHHVELQFITTAGITTNKKMIEEFVLEEEFLPKVYSTKIKIGSIFPNPPGKDAETEFFTLENLDTENVDLNDWQIRNQAGKTYTIQALNLATSGVYLFQSKETKLTLQNESGFLELLNPRGERVDFLEYQDAQEGEVFSHFGGRKDVFQNQTEEVLVEPELQELKGEIISELTPQTSLFWLKTETGEEIQVMFDFETYPFLIAEMFFHKGNQLLINGSLDETGLMHLETFTLLKQAETNFSEMAAVAKKTTTQNSLWFYVTILFILTGGSFLSKNFLKPKD